VHAEQGAALSSKNTYVMQPLFTTQTISAAHTHTHTHTHTQVLVEELVPVMEEYAQNRPTKAKPSGLLNLLVTSVQVKMVEA